MGQFRWGILGSGAISDDFAQALQAAGSQLYGVCNRTASRAEAFAQKYKIKCYPTIEGMLADDSIDIVYIGATHDVHYPYLMAAIANGKHVLCEKTMTINAKQMDAVLRASQQKNVVIQEAMTIFHMPLYHKLRHLIEEGYLGAVKLVQVCFGSYKDDLSSRFFQPDQAGGALLDIGGYAMSFARIFLEEIPTIVQATCKMHESGVDEQWVLGMLNSQGQMVNISLSMCAKQSKRGVVSCEKGYIEVDNYPRATCAKIFFTSDGHTETITAGIGGHHALQYEVEDMEELVKNPRTSRSLQFTSEIIHLLSDIREKEGIRYSCE